MARSTKNDFGRKGWLMIIIAGLCYFFFAGTINDSLNVVVGNFAGKHGLDYNDVLATATPAAWIGIVGVAVWTYVVEKIGSRKVGAIALVLGGLSYAAYGIVSSVAGFFAVTALVNFMAYGFCNTAAQVMLDHWFPTRKGLALGWATMGSNLSGALIIPIINFFVNRTGVSGSFFAVGTMIIVVAVIYMIFVRDTPEEYGCMPDNGALSEDEREAGQRELAEYKSPWTVGKLLKCKQLWLVSISFGIYILVTVSLVSQLVPRLIAGGWSPDKATLMMSISAVLGLLGSYITGWLDQKWGTKNASVVYGIWYLIAVLCCCIKGELMMYLSIFFIGIGIGGIGNLVPSIIGNLFNRYDFARALGVINVITLIIRSFTFSILAFGLEKLGGYTGAYTIIAVLNLIAIIVCAFIKDEPVRAD